MQATEIEKILAPTLQDMGFEWVGLEQSGQGRHLTMRVYIDKPGGINIDEIGKAHRQILAQLKVAGVDTDATTLEVSSPGTNRPLFTLEHFQRFAGQRVKVSLHIPQNGQRHFTGVIQSVEGDNVILDVDSETVSLSYGDIAKAKLSLGANKTQA